MKSARPLVEIVTENRDVKQIVTTEPPESTTEPRGFFEINEAAAEAWSSQRERDLTIQYRPASDGLADAPAPHSLWLALIGSGAGLFAGYFIGRKLAQIRDKYEIGKGPARDLSTEI